MRITIVLADDHVLFLEGLHSLLSQEPDMEILARATTGLEAIAAVGKLSPDIVVMDVSMPDLNGLEATRQIVSAYPNTRVLCLSMHGSEDFVAPALERGASGYLLKECASEELVRAIRCISRGMKYLSPAVAGAAVDGLISSHGSVPPQRTTLTVRELEVLNLIAEGHDTKTISAELSISHKTVASHRANMMEKLGIRGTASLIKYAIQHGLVTVFPES